MATLFHRSRAAAAPSMVRRSVQLLAGLMLFGVSLGLVIRADLGLAPWDVLHQGLAQRSGLSLGTVVIIVSLLVLAAWVPLRLRPGIGTLANAVLVGLFADLTLALVPAAEALGVGIAMLGAGTVVNAVGTALYVGAGLGPGARDGLMVGLASRGYSIRAVRTTIEVTVLAAGWLLGGTVGVGTVVFALAIGPLVHRLLPLFTLLPATRAEGQRPTPSALAPSSTGLPPVTPPVTPPTTHTGATTP
jgi:uncharacterized membrane protein YczE